jgi:OFA family oxalate/formate antiporter-like MFS transporter
MAEAYRRELTFSRWWLIAAAAGAMGVAGVYQFVWSSIRGPIGLRLGTSEASLGAVFTLFIVAQTVSQFPAGWVRDRYGPRLPLFVSVVLLVAGFSLTAFTTSLPVVYLAFVVGGIGAGINYTVAINTAVKWFDDRRGLATGAVGTTYGGMSFLLIPAVRGSVQSAFTRTLLALAVLAGLVTLVAVPVLRDPEVDPSDERGGSDRDVNGNSGQADEGESASDGGVADGTEVDVALTWRDAVRTWQFWVLYGVFVVVNAVGLMIIEKIVSYAQQLGLSTLAATGAASSVAIADAGGVVAGGAASDRFGNERTVALTLVGCGLSIGGAVAVGAAGIDLAFVVLIGLAAMFRSPSFAVLPAIVGEYYGRAHSSENYAALYTAKLWGGLGGGVVASLAIVTVGWNTAFLGGAALVVAAGVATLFVRPVVE